MTRLCRSVVHLSGDFVGERLELARLDERGDVVVGAEALAGSGEARADSIGSFRHESVASRECKRNRCDSNRYCRGPIPRPRMDIRFRGAFDLSDTSVSLPPADQVSLRMRLLLAGLVLFLRHSPRSRRAAAARGCRARNGASGATRASSRWCSAIGLALIVVGYHRGRRSHASLRTLPRRSRDRAVCADDFVHPVRRREHARALAAHRPASDAAGACHLGDRAPLSRMAIASGTVLVRRIPRVRGDRPLYPPSAAARSRTSSRKSKYDAIAVVGGIGVALVVMALHRVLFRLAVTGFSI